MTTSAHSVGHKKRKPGNERAFDLVILVLGSLALLIAAYPLYFVLIVDEPVPVEPQWADWFASWTEHVCAVARMAEENRAD
ncbi:MAG: hypothetical protein IJI38_05960, partial [Clostridia bacterium]|nr:hypothetical protein [Clostridia bacterium]